MQQLSNTHLSRVLRLNEITKRVSLSRSTVYRLIANGDFPKPFKLGIASVGWDSVDIDQWIAGRKLATLH